MMQGNKLAYEGNRWDKVDDYFDDSRVNYFDGGGSNKVEGTDEVGTPPRYGERKFPMRNVIFIED
ncbi:hypothetical protein D3C78_1986180 [compost metagenome]